MLNVDATSFAEIRRRSDGDSGRMADTIRQIVGERGKLQNPCGVLVGRVTAVGAHHDDEALLHQMGFATSLVAVLAGHVVISLPYSVLVILPRLRTLDPSIAEAANDLGASDLRAFWYVTLPLLAPALFSSFLIAFTISFDEFAIASFLAPPGAPTYPVVLYSSSRTPALLPEVIAIGSLIIVLSLLLVVVAEAARRYAERRMEALSQAPPLTAG